MDGPSSHRLVFRPPKSKLLDNTISQKGICHIGFINIQWLFNVEAWDRHEKMHSGIHILRNIHSWNSKKEYIDQAHNSYTVVPCLYSARYIVEKTYFKFSPEKGQVELVQKLPLDWHMFSHRPSWHVRTIVYCACECVIACMCVLDFVFTRVSEACCTPCTYFHFIRLIFETVAAIYIIEYLYPECHPGPARISEVSESPWVLHWRGHYIRLLILAQDDKTTFQPPPVYPTIPWYGFSNSLLSCLLFLTYIHFAKWISLYVVLKPSTT